MARTISMNADSRAALVEMAQVWTRGGQQEAASIASTAKE
jgi:hypothetical protein